MTFSATDIILIIGALSLGSVQIITAIRQEKKLGVIEGHVNSAATRAAGIIEALSAQLLLQREVIDEQKRTAALLAQAVAQASGVQAAAQAVGKLGGKA